MLLTTGMVFEELSRKGTGFGRELAFNFGDFERVESGTSITEWNEVYFKEIIVSSVKENSAFF